MSQIFSSAAHIPDLGIISNLPSKGIVDFSKQNAHFIIDFRTLQM